MALDLDPTNLLMEMLSREPSKKIDLQIRDLVSKNLCVCCGTKPIWRDGNCRACDYEIETHYHSIPTKSGKLAYMNGLYEDGKRLKPYHIRKYRKPVSEIARRAREAS